MSASVVSIEQRESRQARTGRLSSVKSVSFARVLKSEWIKVWSLRSMWITSAFAILSSVLISVIAAIVTNARWDAMSPARRAAFDPTSMSLNGLILAQLLFAVIGVMIVTNEYSTGMIRTSLVAVPRRLTFLAGKMTSTALVALGVGSASAFGAFLLGQEFLGDRGTTLSATNALSSVFGAAFYLMSVAVIASAIGFVVRSTAGGIAITLGLLLVVPLLGQAFQYDLVQTIIQYLPSNAGLSLYGGVVDGPTSTLTASQGIIALTAWMVVTVAAAGVALVRRDA